MKTIEYLVKEEDIRNTKNGEDVVRKLLLGKDPKEYAFVVDYINIGNPIVAMSTGIIFQGFATKGVAKIVIRNHKQKDKLLENPTIKMLIRLNKLEVK